MKRQYGLKALEQMSKTFSDRARDARARYGLWQSETKDLDTPEAKKMYTPAHIAELRKTKLNEARTAIGKELSEMRRVSEPMFKERTTWSKAHFLREARFAAMPNGTLTNEQQVNVELLEAVRGLRAEGHARALDDDDLMGAVSDAATSQDLATLNTLVVECRRRKSERLRLYVDGVVQKVKVPEADEAEACFAAAETALKELEALSYALDNSWSEAAKGAAEFFAWNRNKGDEAGQADGQDAT